MLRQKADVLLLILHIVCTLQTPSQIINVHDTKEFEIALDDMDYDEESENEMIQPVDLADLKPLAEDEGRYKPLHSHVRYYNERNAEDVRRLSNVFPYLRSHAEEIFRVEKDDEPFIAGFKEELDEYFSKVAAKTRATSIGTNPNARSGGNEKSTQNLEEAHNNTNNTTNVTTDQSVRIKREDSEDRYSTVPDEEMDFFQVMRNRTDETETPEHLAETRATLTRYDEHSRESTSNDILEHVVTTERSTVVTDEESYDYSRFKMEYEQQIEDKMRRGKALNYTEVEELEDTPRKALKRIMDLKRPRNCTKEELSQIGVRAMECLVYDYRRARGAAAVRKLLSRTWLVLRVWLLIYICLAIPLWCQRGWCCCCFRCKFCFPRKRILLSKQYYTTNPPGTFVRDLKARKDAIEYEATEYERDAYEAFEAAIKHI